MENAYLICVAGGSGKRMGTETPKQFLLLNERPVLMHTLERMHNFFPKLHIILVLPAEQFDTWKHLCEKHHFTVPHEITEGGKERFDSVKNGLSKIPEQAAVIAIHDGVRPLFSKQTVLLALESATTKGSGIPAIALNDSIRKISEQESQAVNRNEYRLIQTPQCFNAQLIKQAYEQAYRVEYTDDASVAEHYGHKIALTEGNIENIKITMPNDLLIAAALLNN